MEGRHGMDEVWMDGRLGMRNGLIDGMGRGTEKWIAQDEKWMDGRHGGMRNGWIDGWPELPRKC